MSNIPKNIKGETFVIGKKISKGKFGEVYVAVFKSVKNVAIKFDLSSDKNNEYFQKEINLCQKLKKCHGFVSYIGSGTTACGRNFLAMQLLGPSLKQLLNERARPFGLGTVCSIGLQLIEALKILHGFKYAHNDLKPANIAVGQPDSSQIYLIDLGLATKVDLDVEPIKMSTVCGTFFTMAVGAHEGYLSFQTDIESLAYVLISMATGDLPWNSDQIAKNVQNPNDVHQVLNAFLKLKRNNFSSLLVNAPKPLGTLLAASRCIAHNQEPMYDVLTNILKYEFIIKSNHSYSHAYHIFLQG